MLPRHCCRLHGSSMPRGSGLQVYCVVLHPCIARVGMEVESRLPCFLGHAGWTCPALFNQPDRVILGLETSYEHTSGQGNVAGSYYSAAAFSAGVLNHKTASSILGYFYLDVAAATPSHYALQQEGILASARGASRG